MRSSEFLVKTLRTAPRDESSPNAKLLAQGGFIQKLSAGVYTFLPLGLRVLNKIENIVREEMNRAGGAELLMPVLHPRENWEKTGRWKSFDALFRLGDYALGPTHEEIIYPLLKHFIFSWRDLPLTLYQIQTKFRNEARVKSGLLRCREFRMKDLYSFHQNTEDRDRYYEVMRRAYLKIFRRLGIEIIETKASGGTFSEVSLEFQVLAPTGEDTIYHCPKCRWGINEEIALPEAKCAKCRGRLQEARAIELGNIFPLKEKFAQDFKLTFKNKSGEEKLVQAGCYGLGTSRVLGAVAETNHDAKGLCWPENIAPFKVHLVELGAKAEKLYQDLLRAGIEVLYDDRPGLSAGEKFADADLIGIPWRLVVSEKTMKKKKIEVKKRSGKKLNYYDSRSLLRLFLP